MSENPTDLEILRWQARQQAFVRSCTFRPCSQCPSSLTPGVVGNSVFGRATAGFDVIHAIENVRTDKGDKPLDEIKISSITLEG